MTTDTRFDDTDDGWTLADVADVMADKTSDRVRLSRDIAPATDTVQTNGRSENDVDGLEAILFATDFNDHIQKAVLYDSRAELYAVVSAHERSEAMSQAEYDWKVSTIGPDLEGDIVAGEFETDTDRDGWKEWALCEAVRYGDDGGIHAIRPASPGFEFQISDRDVEGLVGDAFSVDIRGTESYYGVASHAAD